MASITELLPQLDWDKVFPIATLILGGWLGSRWALRLEIVRRMPEIDAVLAAISCELEILADIYMETSGRALAECEAYYSKKFLLTKQYFIVYPSNTRIVGQVMDAVLSRAIVRTYTFANFLLESFEINNVLLDELNDLNREVTRGNDPTAHERLEHQKTMLCSHLVRLKKIDQQLKEATEDLIPRISDYRGKHPAKADSTRRFCRALVP